MPLIQMIIKDTPIGCIGLSASENALVRLDFLRDSPQGTSTAGNAVLELAKEQIKAYFAGQLKAFSVPLAPEGTVFQLAVWRQLSLIPYGETRSYGNIAEALGQPGAARAVGMANNRNPLPLVIPCHRVIGADGQLVGFGGGLDIKQQLLALEHPQLQLF